MKSGGQITIKDLARELNISPSTVSRALKNHPDISSETKQLVRELADKLNYQPNTLAMGLRQRKSNTIGVILPQFIHFFFSTVISGIEDVAYSKGYSIIVAQSNEDLEREKLNLQELYHHRVDGILMSISRESDSVEHIEAMIDKGIPLVFFDRAHDKIQCSRVLADDFKGAYEATKHLIDLGYTRIAHLAGPYALDITQKRLGGYKKALMDHGLGIDSGLIFFDEKNTNEIYGMEKAIELANKRNGPKAIFANNDMTALGAMKGVRMKGLEVPKDMAIIGFSNWQFTQMVDPPLTTVDQPGFRMGQEAARLLIREIESKDAGFVEPETIILDTRLIIRGSTQSDALD